MILRFNIFTNREIYARIITKTLICSDHVKKLENEVSKGKTKIRDMEGKVNGLSKEKKSLTKNIGK